jgi:DNA-binding response OmpR family regulator
VAVLEYLLRAAGRVVSKSELLEHCWDVNFEGDPAVVEVLMHRLRRKIEAASGPASDPGSGADSDPGSAVGAAGGPVIETVRGQGYVIRAARS